jgi:tetratricopeptide (TPR) repeat protein
MLNVHDLERRWIKYKIKSILPLLLTAIGIIVVTIVSVIYIPLSDIKDSTVKKVPEPQANLQKEETLPSQENREQVEKGLPTNTIAVPQNTQVQQKIESRQALVLKPSLRFMDNIEDGLSSYVQDDHYQLSQNQPRPDNTLDYQSNQVLVEQPQASIDEPKIEEKKLTLSISSKKSDEDLKDVIRRFKKNKNPALSLFIAKHYYNAGEYQKSYNYALMTNEIDKSIDESWIIFSKSLVKLGQHELAMNTLKSYLKTSKSSAAEVLLRKIESGSFK